MSKSKLSYDMVLELLEIIDRCDRESTIGLLNNFIMVRVDLRIETRRLTKFDTEYLEDVAVSSGSVTMDLLGTFLTKHAKEGRTWVHLKNIDY